ncbi:MAG: hypothetical protein AAF333_04740 [Planctomycetota bacterium]
MQKATRSILEEIVSEVRNGGSFIPMIGSGVSVGSGVPTIRDLTKYYLPSLVRKSLRRPGSPSNDPAFNPNVDPWPPYRWSNHRYDEEREYIRNVALNESTIKQYVIDLCDRTNTGDKLSFVKAWVANEGSVYEWTASLQYLSRIQPPNHAVLAKHPQLGEANRSIIDSFFRFLMQGHIPGLEYRMLAELSSILRVRVAVTPNFDELYETAMQDHGLPTTVFDVHYDATLPTADLVLAERRSLVKVHGGRYGIRADFSVQADLTASDRRNFLGYLQGRPLPSHVIDHLRISGKPLDPPLRPVHLIVAGVGATERRMNELIRMSLSATKDLKVYYFAYTDDDADRARREFGDALKGNHERLCIIQTQQLGLTLVDLHSRLVHSMPSAGVIFPAVWQIPTPPLSSESSTDDPQWLEKKALDSLRSNAAKLLIAASDKTEDVSLNGPAVAYSTDQALANVYRKLTDEGKKCIWVDADEALDGEDFAHNLYWAIHKRQGRQPQHAIARLNSVRPGRLAALAEQIAECVPDSGDEWVFFVDLSEIYIDTTWTSSPLYSDAHRNRDSSCAWSGLDYQHLLEFLIKELPRHIHRASFCIITRNQQDAPPSNYTDNNFRFLNLPPSFPGRPNTSIDFCSYIDGSIAALRREWGKESRSLSNANATLDRLLLLSAHLNISRYPSVFTIWYASQDVHLTTNLIRQDLHAKFDGIVDSFLDLLEEHHLAQVKPGGLVWMHNDVRRFILPGGNGRSLCSDIGNVRATDLLDLHQATADWYQKLTLTSGDSQALLESLHHRVRCVEIILDKLNIPDQRFRLLTCLLESAVLLRIARLALLSRGNTVSACLRLDRICARLEDLADKLKNLESTDDATKQAYLDLTSILLQSQHRLAVEVDDHSTAIVRHEEWRASHDEANALPGLEDTDPAQHLIGKLEYAETLIASGERRYTEGFMYIRQVIIDLLKEKKSKRLARRLIHRLIADQFDDTKSGQSGGKKILMARKWGARLGRLLHNRPKDLAVAVRAIRRLMEVSVFNADITYVTESMHRRPQTRSNFLGQNGGDAHNSDNLWLIYALRAIVLYHIAAETTRFMNPSFRRVVSKERSRLRTLLGLALAMTNQASDSRRRFNEAVSYNSFLPDPAQYLGHAVQCVVRSEAILMTSRFTGQGGSGYLRHEIHSIRNDVLDGMIAPISLKGPKRAIVISWITDASHWLDRAEKVIQGRRRLVQWVGRYNLQRIRCQEYRHLAYYGEVSPDVLREFLHEDGFRPVNGFHIAIEHLEVIRRMVRFDAYLLARALHSVHVCRQCLISHANFLNAEAANIRSNFGKVQDTDPWYLDDFAERFRRLADFGRDPMRAARKRLCDMHDQNVKSKSRFEEGWVGYVSYVRGLPMPG